MTGKREISLAACLFAVFTTVFLAAPESFASDSCAEQLKDAKRQAGDPSEMRPHMGGAYKHIAAAEAALQNGDEAKCLEDVQKAIVIARRNRTRGGDK